MTEHDDARCAPKQNIIRARMYFKEAKEVLRMSHQHPTKEGRVCLRHSALWSLYSALYCMQYGVLTPRGTLSPSTAPLVGATVMA